MGYAIMINFYWQHTVSSHSPGGSSKGVMKQGKLILFTQAWKQTWRS